MPLPDFIIIGAQKCGTSSLHNYLDAHPDIGMSIEKEVQYFNEGYRWEKGLDWYKSRFREGPGFKGEASPQYTWYPFHQQSAREMHKLLPDIKLIYMVRDPITRIASQYQDWVAQFWERGNFEQVMQSILSNPEDRYRVTSSYWYQLEHYLEFYSPAQIKVVAQEDMYHNRTETIQDIIGFIGADPDFKSDIWEERIHTGEEKRRPNKLMQWVVGDWLRMQLLEPRAISHRTAYYIRQFIQMTGSPVERPNPTGEDEQKLIELFRNDVHKLREFAGQSFPHWRAY